MRFAIAISLWIAGQLLTRAQVIWSGADAIDNVNTNWSDATNWIGGKPGKSSLVYFFDAGSNAVRGVVNNVADGNTTISYLEYGNTNGFHTTQINPGVSLTVSNTASSIPLFVGTGTDNGSGQTLYSIINGPGSLVVVDTNIGSSFMVQQGSANNGNHMATLDLSGLANFKLTVGRLFVGGGNPSTGASNWLAGTLYLAATNYIRVNGAAPALDEGDCLNNGGTNHVYLGQTNAIFADSMAVAHSKATGTLAFNPALLLNDPFVSLNGNTNARMGLLTIGDFSAQSTSGSTTVGTMDLTGGTGNCMVNACYVGLGQTGSGSGPASGTLRLGAGVFNVNALNVGYVSASTAAGSVSGTLVLTNGTLVVNSNLLLAYNAGAAASATGTLNITNGTLLASKITAGGGTSKVVMSGGWLAVTNTLGTPSAPLSSLMVRQGATLQFGVAGNQTNAAFSSVTGDNTTAVSIQALPIVVAYPTQYPLIYSPSHGASGVQFSLDALPSGYTGYISNDNSSMIWLVITNGPSVPKTDQWAGSVNNNWDTNTPNWTSNNVPVTYAENDFALFNDGASTNLVNLVGAAPHTPYSWTVTNNALNYKFVGTNNVGGLSGLIKSGSASVTLADSGDTFKGGISVIAGTVVLDEAGASIGGGLTISSNATAQIGDSDANGGLPAGALSNSGALVFNQTITNLVATGISGSGSLAQIGSGVLQLSGASTYTGNTMALHGTLALVASGSIADSANVAVSNATLDVSGVTNTTALVNLNMTNGVLAVGTSTLNVSGLNLGGSGNTLNVAALPPILFYPTNITLVQSESPINGYNFVLGSLPAGKPAFAGALTNTGSAVRLVLDSGPLSVVSATVSFSPTNYGLVLNHAFPGLSYEKGELTGSLFVSNDVSMVAMFNQIAPAVLRVGGNSVDTTCWGGLSNLTAITTGDVDAFAGFVHALSTNWHVIYGINMSVNNPSNCAAEASYVAKALGSSLLGFEIGNECDLYSGNGIRPSTYTFSQFLSQWQALAEAITNTTPGWAITNGGSGWTLTGPASADNTSGYTVPFAGDEAGVISMLTQHYYRGNGQSASSTIEFLLQPDTALPGRISTLASAASSAKLPFGFRMAECGSYYNGGAPNVSDGYGTALWALDFMSIMALNGAQGLNFHGGGNGTGYTPIADNGAMALQARPEFYGLKMFSLLAQGSIVPATLTLASNVNFTAYGVRRPSGGISALLNNKETNDSMQVNLNLGPDVTAAQYIWLNGPALSSTNGYTLGGAAINANGSWSGGMQGVISATNGQLSVIVPPISAVLLNPVVTEGANLLLTNDALNTSSWTAATNWTDGWPPHAGANYFTAGNLLRTPLSGSPVTFAGDSLTIGPAVPGNASLKFKLNSPGGTCIINNCTNAGGLIDAGVSNATNYLSGTNWFISAPSAFGMASDNTRSIVLTNLILAGSATLSNGVANSSDELGAIVYAGDSTDFTGPLVTSLGATLLAYSQTNLGGNPGSFNAAQFVLDGGTFQPLASMGLTNANSGVTIYPGGGTFNVAPNLALTIANPIAGSGDITLQGGGLLALSASNPCSGALTVSAGTLALQGAGSISNCAAITIAGGAVFDVSGLNAAFILASGQTLSNGAVQAVISGANNTGSGVISLFYDGSRPAFIITNGVMSLAAGTIFNVNNAGATLPANNNYKLIARATNGNPGFVAGAAPVFVTVSGNGAAQPASLQITDGELYLNVPPIVPAAGTNIMFGVTSNQLILSWPTNYIGWLLQSQTNTPGGGLNTNWVNVTGANMTNQVALPLNSTNGAVFFRMAHP